MSNHSQRDRLLGLSAIALFAALLAALSGTALAGAEVMTGGSILAGSAGDQVAAPDHPASTPPPTCHPAPKGMLAWWPFEALEGGEPSRPDFYRDWAGVNNHAELGVAPVVAPGLVGGGIALDGATQFLEAPDHPELDLGTGDFSIDAWVKLAADATGFRTIVDKRTFSPVRGYAFFTFNGQVSLQLGDGSAGGNACGSNPALTPCTNFNSLRAINDGNWHFVAVSVRRAGESFFYVDGDKIPFSAASRPLSLDNAAPLRIGQHAQSGALWQGSLDELEIFDRAMSETELAAIRAAGPLGKCSPEGGLRGVAELVNFDAVNACGSDAVGVQLTLSGFQAPSQPDSPYEANSAYFSFDTIYEVACPNPAPGIPDCNPFTPDQAKPIYGQDHIELAWGNARTLRVVPPGGKAHFGYTLATGDLEVFHTIRADWRLQSGGPSCFILGDSTTWAMPPPGSAARAASREGAAQGGDHRPRAPGRVAPHAAADTTNQATTVNVVVRNPSAQAMQVNVWGFGSPDHLRLDDLVSSNARLWRFAGSALASASLAPRAAVTVSFPIDPRSWGAVVITDWYDGQTNTLRARSFRARPLGALLPPGPTPTPTLTLAPVTPSHTPTGPGPSPTPSPTPTRTVSPTPTGRTPTPPTRTPTRTPVAPATPPPGTPSAVPSTTPSGPGPGPTCTPPPCPCGTLVGSCPNVRCEVCTPTPAAPQAQICPGLASRVPPAVLAWSVANPERVNGYGLHCTPSQPPGPFNGLRSWLALQNNALTFHPLFNSVVLRCGCR